ncbi:hypothetical protein bpSLO_001182 (plasmid) [Borrelia parkeri]|uniref:hypothetical protein n=1 Tax=Borrelia parkeri TaxID=141 RepID=UPI001FF3CCBA|nr:hypothetical protein [Borrelia parkeri]UPA11329.1 hypothetical protein bpSLO_001182 [Borrelia parkeri]
MLRIDELIEYIRKLVISSDTSDGRRYNDYEFYCVLGFLGFSEFKRLIRVNLGAFLEH